MRPSTIAGLKSEPTTAHAPDQPDLQYAKPVTLVIARPRMRAPEREI
jgi:hypothetical protein